MTKKEITHTVNSVNTSIDIFLNNLSKDEVEKLIEAIDKNFTIVKSGDKIVSDYNTKYWDLYNSFNKLFRPIWSYSVKNKISDEIVFPIAAYFYFNIGVKFYLTQYELSKKVLWKYKLKKYVS